MTRRIHPIVAQRALVDGLEDLKILDGREVSGLENSSASWQDVAGTAATNLQVVAAYLLQIRNEADPTILSTEYLIK